MTARPFLAMIVVAALGAGCGPSDRGDAAPGGTADPHTVAERYDPALDVDLERMTATESGLRVQDLEPGTGAEATPGDLVSVHYTGWLPDGTEFDSSRTGRPFEFTLGRGMVIPGWDEGVAGMREGGRRKLVIPPALGYGAAGAGGVIPPNATLVFDVELLQVR
jgi:FKBP-type peptidyl-prolyl cis-trans isomerase